MLRDLCCRWPRPRATHLADKAAHRFLVRPGTAARMSFASAPVTLSPKPTRPRTSQGLKGGFCGPSASSTFSPRTAIGLLDAQLNKLAGLPDLSRRMLILEGKNDALELRPGVAADHGLEMGIEHAVGFGTGKPGLHERWMA